MNVKKEIPLRNRPAEVPSVAQRVADLRKSLAWSQKEFADAVGVSQSKVAKWETGKLKPPGHECAVLAQLARPEDKPFWLGLAGLAGTATIDIADTGSRQIPLLKDAAACGTPRAVNEREIEEVISFPSVLLPRGGNLFAVRVTGDSMSPLLEEGYVAVIDVARRDVAGLIDHLVLAREGDEVTVKWLRKQDEMYLLVPQNTARHQIRVWSTSDNRAIVGEVVRWIGIPPPPKKRK